MLIQNNLLPNKQEIITYDYPGIPIHTELRSLSQYYNMRSVLHWHEDLELMRVINGKMYYCTDKKRILLQTNDSILVNSKRLHYYVSAGHTDCTFSCVTIHPQLLTGNPVMHDLLIDPVLNDINHSEFYFPRTHSFHELAAKLSDDIIEESAGDDYAYLLTILSRFEWLFYEVARMYDLYGNLQKNFDDKKILRQMTSYITVNYMNKISVDDIAEAGAVSRSKCYHLFEEFENTTPLDYLNNIRLKTARGLLRDSKLKIIDISYACGFSYCNYFTSAFKKKYGATPLVFRKRMDKLIK